MAAPEDFKIFNLQLVTIFYNFSELFNDHHVGTAWINWIKSYISLIMALWKKHYETDPRLVKSTNDYLFLLKMKVITYNE